MPTRPISRDRADAAVRSPKPDKDHDVLPGNLVEISEECRSSISDRPAAGRLAPRRWRLSFPSLFFPDSHVPPRERTARCQEPPGRLCGPMRKENHLTRDPRPMYQGGYSGVSDPTW